VANKFGVARIVDVSAAVGKGLALLKSDPPAAESLAREILRDAPDHPDANMLLGAALRVKGDLVGAQAVLEPLAGAQTKSWIVQFEWAQLLLQSGLTRKAASPLSLALALRPGFTQGWRLLYEQLTYTGEPAEAQDAYARMVRSTLSRSNLIKAADALIAGRLDSAQIELEGILQRTPNDGQALHLLAEASSRLGRLNQAEKLLTQCVQSTPNFYLAHQSLAVNLFRQGRWSRALSYIEKILEYDPRNLRCLMLKAAALDQVGDYGGAAECFKTLLDSFPDQPKAWLMYGHALRTLGKLAESIGAYKNIIVLDPEFGEAYWSLANLKTYRFTTDEISSMRALLQRKHIRPADRSALNFALGKALEDTAAYADAFGHYSKGAAIDRAGAPYDADQTRTFVERSKVLFTRAFFAERAQSGVDAPDPIFILGMPRSGSTLIEQILSCHSAVQGTRELPDIANMAAQIAVLGAGGREVRYPDTLAMLRPDAAVELGREYLTRANVHRTLGLPHFTDKAPLNFLHIGFIHLILPNAKIIDVRRHPLGCCLSAFKHHFAGGWSFSSDLTELGRFYADYVDLMSVIDQSLPGLVHRVIYEDLVADPEREVRRLLDYLQLPFEAACLRFYDNDRAVATPSSEQVRQPIFTQGVDQWRQFDPWLGPLKAALGRVLDAYPAVPTD